MSDKWDYELEKAIEDACQGMPRYWPHGNTVNAFTNNASTTAPQTVAEMMKAMDKAKQILATRQTADILTGIDQGVPVHADKYLTKTRKPPTRRRRRLWRHWKATRTIPDPNVYLIAGQMLVGHPDTIARMVEALNR